MLLLTSKLSAALIILLISLIAGLWPLIAKTTDKNKAMFAFGEAFASGVFLGAALLHMLPDAENGMRAAIGDIHFPIVNTLCLISFTLLLFIEKVAVQVTNEKLIESKSIVAYVLAIVLSIHSIIAGAALGINSSLAGAMVIFIAIIAHKGSESFALSMTVKRSSLTSGHMRSLITLFSIMTPIGILAGAGITEVMELQHGQIMEAGFNAVAAGTFLYIATLHSIDQQFIQNKTKHLQSFFALLIGLLMTGVIAIWV